MPEDESIPLPRCWGEPEHVADRDRVRTGVSHEKYPPTGPLHIPDRQIMFSASNSAFSEEQLDPEVDSIDEIAHRLAPVETMPSIIWGLAAHLGVGLLGLLSWGASPTRVADLSEPWCDHLRLAQAFQQRSSGLTGSRQRRHQDLIEGLSLQSIGQVLSLLQAEFGEWGITHRKPVANPLRLTMPYKNDLHGPDGTVTV